MSFFFSVFQQLDVPQSATVMDLGCGKGNLVKELRTRGYEAFGCDFDNKHSHGDKIAIRSIDSDPYRLPFEDSSLDVTVSTQVFEHVMDYQTTLAEIHRVLKPGGYSCNIFPARWLPLEPHVHVPLATTMRARWWLQLWAQLGIRNQYQKNKTAAEVTTLNYEYLHSHTNYPPRHNVLQFAKDFSYAAFREDMLLSKRRFLKAIPALSWALSNFYCRFLVLQK